ncbi:DUF3501 family protein [Pseudomonadota bacterium]
MQKLTRDSLYSLEEYSIKREEFRNKVMQHKKFRRLDLGEHISLYFEDRLTMQYQVQEMLRAERIFEAAAIHEELDAYNPLIPDGSNLKATLMIQYENEDERRAALQKLVDIENQIWLKIDGFDKVRPIADEDLERTDENKTSAVHFLRFEFNQAMISALKTGAKLATGVDHPAYQFTMEEIPKAITQALANDFE